MAAFRSGGCVAGWRHSVGDERPARSPSCFSSVKATAAPFPSRSWLGEPVFPICSPFQGCIFQCFWVSARLFVPCFSVPTGRSGQGWSFPVCLCSSPVPNLPWSELLGWPLLPDSFQLSWQTLFLPACSFLAASLVSVQRGIAGVSLQLGGVYDDIYRPDASRVSVENRNVGGIGDRARFSLRVAGMPEEYS